MAIHGLLIRLSPFKDFFFIFNPYRNPPNVCVGLKCRNDVFSILNNVKLLHNNFRISTDRNKLQMNGLIQAYDLANKHFENSPTLIDETYVRLT